jgi:hypothetical protein
MDSWALTLVGLKRPTSRGIVSREKTRRGPRRCRLAGRGVVRSEHGVDGDIMTTIQIREKGYGIYPSLRRMGNFDSGPRGAERITHSAAVEW